MEYGKQPGPYTLLTNPQLSATDRPGKALLHQIINLIRVPTQRPGVSPQRGYFFDQQIFKPIQQMSSDAGALLTSRFQATSMLLPDRLPSPGASRTDDIFRQKLAMP